MPGSNSQFPFRLIFWLITIGIILFVPQVFWLFIFIYFLLLGLSSLYRSPEFRKKMNISEKIDSIFKNKSTVETKQSSKYPNYFIPMEQFQFKKIYVLYACIVLAILFIIIDGLVSVPAGHAGVIYDRGRGVLDEAYPEGLHLKIPFWQVATVMDTRLQTYTMSIAPAEGAQYGDDSIEGLTKDGQRIFVDISIQFRIKREDAPWILQQIGIDYRTKVIRPGVRNVVRDIITGYDSTNLFTQETRKEAQEKMEEDLKRLYVKNKIQLEDLLLRNIKFSDVYLQAIEDKQVAQQRIQKAEYERQEAEKLKEKRIIEAQAEAESIRLKGETLKANPEVIQLEFVNKIAGDIKWGILPDKIMPLLDLKNM